MQDVNKYSKKYKKYIYKIGIKQETLTEKIKKFSKWKAQKRAHGNLTDTFATLKSTTSITRE